MKYGNLPNFVQVFFMNNRSCRSSYIGEFMFYDSMVSSDDNDPDYKKRINIL